MSRSTAPRSVSLHDPHQRATARRALAKADPRLAGWMERLGDVWRPRRLPYFALLCHTIVNQQISVQAGATIGRRLRDAAGGRLSPESLAAVDETTLVACGLSRQKRAALRDLTDHVLTGRLQPDHLWRRTDEEAIEAITQVRGLGRWSAEMFLIFGLGRPDVWSLGDLGLRNGLVKLAELEEVPTPMVMTALGEAWRPWRSLASCYLWALLDPVAWAEDET